MLNLPSAPPGVGSVVLAPEVWDRVRDLLTRCVNFSVAAPLQLSDTPAGRALSIQLEPDLRIVKVTGNAAGGGKYLGQVLQGPGTVSESGDLTEDEIGLRPSSDNCLILNADEVSQSTHDLTAGTPRVKWFIGFPRGTTSGTPGKYVYAINGLDIKDCTGTPALGIAAPTEGTGASGTGGVGTTTDFTTAHAAAEAGQAAQNHTSLEAK